MATAKLGAVFASLCAALFLFVYKGWFEARIFSTMSPDQTFSAFIWTTSVAAILVFISLIGHFMTQPKRAEKVIMATGGGIAFDNSGSGNQVEIEK